jgi:hypothetical protein
MELIMRWMILIMVVSLVFLIPSESFARIYKWVDENGKVHMSDREPTRPEKEKSKRRTEDVEQNSKFDFRKTNWGISRYEVLQIEDNKDCINSEYTDFDEMIIYKTKAFGKTCGLVYEFLQDKLVCAEYAFLGDKKRGDISVADFVYFESQLKKTYGEPKTEKTDALPYQASWETDSTEIQIVFKHLTFVDYHGCNIEFKSKKLEPLMEKRYSENKAKLQQKVEKMFSKFQKKNQTSNTEYDGDFSDATNAIRNDCANKWQNDFRMQEYCIQKQEDAIIALKKGKPSDIPSDVFSKIRSECKSKWENDFRMREHCEKKQCSAWRRLDH